MGGMQRLKPFLAILLAVSLAAGLCAGAWALFHYSEGREEQFHFFAGMVYGVTVALFIGSSLAVFQFLALNFIFPLFPDIDFEEMKFPILIVQACVALALLAILSVVLPIPLSEL